MSPRRLANLFKLVDANDPVGKDGADVETASHGVNDLAQRDDVHEAGQMGFGIRGWGKGRLQIQNLRFKKWAKSLAQLLVPVSIGRAVRAEVGGQY
jgi:hypothetical protein